MVEVTEKEAAMSRILSGVIIFIAGALCGMILTYGPLHAQGAISEGDIMAKLNKISKGQEDMMAALNSIKEELQIIKIRVTQSQ